MRRITTTETDPVDNRRTRVKHRYIETEGGLKVAPVGIGGGPGSRAAERGLVAPRDGDAGDQAGAEAGAIGGFVVNAPELERLVGERLEQERQSIEARIALARQEGLEEGRAMAPRQAAEVDRRVAELTAENQRLKLREAVLMDQVDKLSGEVAKLQQRADKTEGEVLRLRDNLAQISASHGEQIDRLENALGMLGEAAAKAANSTKD
jgi:hypothetical protein